MFKVCMQILIRCHLILICIFLLNIFSLSGCATSGNYQRSLQHWQGLDMQELTLAWGHPDAGVKLPNGNTVYVYNREQLYTMPSYTTPPASIVNVGGRSIYASSFNGDFAGNRVVSRHCRTWFEVNPQGKIIRTQFQGNNCVA